MFTRHCTLLLVAPVLAATLSGCGLWDSWKQRVGYQPSTPAPTAYNDEPYESQAIQPGHSTEADVYNEHYDPYREQNEKFAPPPAPPIRPDLPPSPSAQPIIDQQARREPAPATEGQLIKTLKTPRIFSPESVRSIYDRFRGQEHDRDQSVKEKPDGPIAQHHILESPTRACLYCRSESSDDSPVQLGIPEVDGDPLVDHTHPLLEDPSQLPVVMQACPSAYKHPLLADPTGVPYGSH